MKNKLNKVEGLSGISYIKSNTFTWPSFIVRWNFAYKLRNYHFTNNSLYQSKTRFYTTLYQTVGNFLKCLLQFTSIYSQHSFIKSNFPDKCECKYTPHHLVSVWSRTTLPYQRLDQPEPYAETIPDLFLQSLRQCLPSAIIAQKLCHFANVANWFKWMRKAGFFSWISMSLCLLKGVIRGGESGRKKCVRFLEILWVVTRKGFLFVCWFVVIECCYSGNMMCL